MSITEEKIKKIALTYIDPHCDYTMAKLAELNGISRATLSRYFSGNGPVKLTPELQEEVSRVKHERWLAGKSTNGNLGHKKYSDEEIIAAANKMIEDGLTLRDLASSTNDPSIGTLSARFNEKTLGTELYQKVTGQYEQNIAFKSISKEKPNSSDTSELDNMINEAVAGQNQEKSHPRK